MNKIIELIQSLRKEADECEVEGCYTSIAGSIYETGKRELLIDIASRLEKAFVAEMNFIEELKDSAQTLISLLEDDSDSNIQTAIDNLLFDIDQITK